MNETTYLQAELAKMQRRVRVGGIVMAVMLVAMFVYFQWITRTTAEILDPEIDRDRVVDRTTIHRRPRVPHPSLDPSALCFHREAALGVPAPQPGRRIDDDTHAELVLLGSAQQAHVAPAVERALVGPGQLGAEMEARSVLQAGPAAEGASIGEERLGSCQRAIVPISRFGAGRDSMSEAISAGCSELIMRGPWRMEPRSSALRSAASRLSFVSGASVVISPTAEWRAV